MSATTKMMLPALACAMATSLPAQPAPEKASDRVICHKIQRVGSRLNAKRVCRTKGEWDKAANRAGKDVADFVDRRMAPSIPSAGPR